MCPAYGPFVDDTGRARVRVRLGGVVILVLVGLGCAVLVSVFSRNGGAEVVEPPTAAASTAPNAGARIFVHVLGAVERPGLYELTDGARVVDAVAAAGGFTDVADQAGINLARFVSDGEQLRVPAIGEVPVAAPGTTADGLVNLNTADTAALETLPRVGPALAARIIDWREANGGFGSVEDLRNVTGIGDKTFDGLKDLVTV
jgi:competence protein ComEA